MISLVRGRCALKLKGMDHYSLEPANFKDYRDFLRNRFEQIQKTQKSFSLGACATRAKISKSLLRFIFRKERHLSLDRMPKLAKALKLDEHEESFVYLKICQDSSRNPAIRAHFEGLLNRIRHAHVKVEEAAPPESTADEKALYLNGMKMIGITLPKLPGFREDDEWLARVVNLPGVAPQELRTLFGELEKQGFLFRDETGRLRAKPESLWRPDPLDPTGMMVYTRAAEFMAFLMKEPKRYRPSVYMSMSIPFDEKNLLEAEKVMIELHHRLFRLSQESVEPTAVAQFGNFFLTVARGG